ncbi:MAG: 4Fe-4S dicluster domain-containing protein, partial [Candidatus Limnocylindrales bacterium]
MTETNDRRRSLAEPYTPGSGNGEEPWDAQPDTVAVAPPAVPGRDERTTEFLAEWHNGSYICFSSGHMFCREVCPVVQVTRNESWSPTAFHANVVAMERGHLDVADVAADYVNCTQCGACELRCPNTLFTGDFYRFRTRT